MPKGSFKGAAASALVMTLYAPASAAIVWPEPETGRSISIETFNDTLYAPAGFVVKAVFTGFPQARPEHDLRVKWNFDKTGIDPDLKFTSLEGHVGAELSAKGYDDRFTGYTPWSAVCYDKPGTYTVEVEVFDGQAFYYQTRQFTVEDPDVVIPIERHLYVSTDPAETFAGVPAGAQTLITDKFKTALNASPGPSVLNLKRGQSYKGCGKVGLGRRVVRAWGDPELPNPFIYAWLDTSIDRVVDAYQVSWGSPTDHLALLQIDIENPYDASTQTGWDFRAEEKYLRYDGFTTTGTLSGSITLHQCNMRGCNKGYNFTHFHSDDTSGAENMIVLSDSTNYNDRDFSLWISNSDWMGIIGCRFEKHYLAMGGTAGGKNSLHMRHIGNAHGVFRSSRGSDRHPFVGRCNKWFGNNGWSGGNPLYPTALPVHQPILRIFTGGNSGWTMNEMATFERNISEGTQFLSIGGSGGAPSRPMNLIIEKFYHVFTANAVGGNIGAIHNGGTTVRNGVLLVPPVENELLRPGGDSGAMLEIYPGSDPHPDNAAAPVRFHDIAMITWQDPVVHKLYKGANNPFDVLLLTAWGFDSITVENILMHCPQYMAPASAGGPALDERATVKQVGDLSSILALVGGVLGEKLFDTNYAGLKWENLLIAGDPVSAEDLNRVDQPTLLTQFATPETFVHGAVTQPVVVLPYVNASAPTGAAVPGRLDDMFGTIRAAGSKAGPIANAI